MEGWPAEEVVGERREGEHRRERRKSMGEMWDEARELPEARSANTPALVEAVLKDREEGNVALKEGRLREAMKKYNEALDAAEWYGDGGEGTRDLLEASLAVELNITLVLLKGAEQIETLAGIVEAAPVYREVVAHATVVLTIDPANVKARYRLEKALAKLGEGPNGYSEARAGRGMSQGKAG